MNPTAVETFLWFIRDNPTILPPAPPMHGGHVMDDRSAERLPCVCCGKPSRWAFVADNPADPSFGHRWLDLCDEHNDWLRNGLNDLTIDRKFDRSPAPGQR